MNRIDASGSSLPLRHRCEPVSSSRALWALVASHGAWCAASSVECKQAERAEEDIAADVVQKLVEKTDLRESA